MKNKRVLIFICISIVVIAFLGVGAFYIHYYFCSGMWLDPKDLPGTYVGCYDNNGTWVTIDREKGIYKKGTHRLDLHTDGTYTYVYTPVKGIETGCSGKWKYDTFDHGLFEDKELVLENFIFAPENPEQVGGFWDARVRKINGHIGFLVDGDRFFYLVKDN